MKSPFQHIRIALEHDFSGRLCFEEHEVFFDRGKLLTATTSNDAMWLLRRLMCGGWITEEFAAELEEKQLPIDIRCFPTITPKIWSAALADRARQNLFDLSFSMGQPDEFPSEITPLSPLRGYQSAALIDEIESHSQRFSELRRHLDQVWIQRLQTESDHEIIGSCPMIFKLPSLMAQAPLEELDLLLELERLESEGVLLIALNEDALSNPNECIEGMSEDLEANYSEDEASSIDADRVVEMALEMTEDEREMFSESEDNLDQGHFSIDKENLDRIALPSPEEQAQVYSMLTQANQLLRVMSRWVEASGKPAIDWLMDLHEGEAVAHDAFVEASAVSEQGELVLKSAIEAPLAASALGSLLNRAAKSPLAGEGRRTFLRAIDRWEQKWRL